MNETLKQRLIHVRETLEATDPTAGFIALPSLRRALPEIVPKMYQEFLETADGAACGVVILYESEGLSELQGPVRSLPGGSTRWFCFGAVEDYPLIMDRRTGAVHLIPLEGPFDEGDSLGDFDHFLATSVFGDEYADFVLDPESDSWYPLVRSGCG